MEVDDDTVVDLSVKRDRDMGPPPARSDVPQDLSRVHRVEEIGISEVRGLIPRGLKDFDDKYPRRNLRPRTERNYAESPDVILVSDPDEEPRMNGYTNGFESESTDEGEMPPIIPIKQEMTPQELEERERNLRKLREELRNEEMKLVLLKKLRQSQQMKENIAVVPPTQQPQAGVGPSVVPGVGVPAKPPVPGKLPPPPQQQPPPPLVRANHSKQTNVPPLLRGQPPPARPQSIHHPPPLMLAPQAGRTSATSLPPNMMMNQQPLPRGSSSLGRTPVNTPPNVVLGYPQDRTKEAHHSPAPPAIPAQPERPRVEDTQTPAQRQAAAKLALRKQLEKTLLQIPPPKPPPPEMHFIPNPSNTEFIYLLGLEHVVDFITKDQKTPPPPDAFKCSQCFTDFTPVWKWEKNPSKGKEPKVICEQCVTTNVKKALKAEHTNRLKTAFVKALQQEQEIEQRLAQAGGASPEPVAAAAAVAAVAAAATAPPPPPPAAPKPATPTRQHAPTPPPPPPPTPPAREHPLAKLAAETAAAAAGKFGATSAHHVAAALHQQLLRGLPQHQPLPAHVLSAFNPMLYPYQLAVAGSKGPVATAAANLVELQRQAVDLQRQYLLDMIPPPSPSPSRSHINNWKT